MDSPPAVSPQGRRRGAAVIRSGLLSMLAIAALGITRLVHGALVARDTDEPGFAAVGLLIGATMMAGLFLPGGLSSAAAKFIPYHLGRSDEPLARAVYRLLLIIGYACSVVLGVIVGVGSLFYGFSDTDALWVGLLTVAFSVYSLEKSALYGFDRVESYVRFELAGSAVAIALTIVVVALGWHTYLMPLTVGYIALIFGAWWILRRRSSSTLDMRGARVSVPKQEKREIAGYVGMASLGGLASAGLLQALPLLADIYTNKHEVAYFAAAVGLVAPLYFLPRALGMALFPAMAHAHGAGDVSSVRRQADLSTRALFVVLAPLFVVAILLSRQILTLVFGSRFAGGAVVLQVILLATYLMVTQVAAVNTLSSGTAREVRVPVSSAVAGWFAGVGAAIPLGLAYGAVGVGLAYVLAAAVSAAWPLSAVAKRHELAWLGPVGRSLAVVVAGLVLAQMLPHGWLVEAGAAVLAGGVAAALLYRDLRRILGDARYSE